MITLTLNILCDGKDCSECITTAPVTFEDIGSEIRKEINHARWFQVWDETRYMYFCSKCAEHKRTEIAKEMIGAK